MLLTSATLNRVPTNLNNAYRESEHSGCRKYGKPLTRGPTNFPAMSTPAVVMVQRDDGPRQMANRLQLEDEIWNVGE